MRRIPATSLWIGHIGDVRNLRAVLDAGIEALVDLEIMELPPPLTRELVYCRFPLLDGAGNPEWKLRGAIEIVARLVVAEVPTLVYCGAGMSRSPCIAAAALARTGRYSFEAALELVFSAGPADVSPGFLADVKRLVTDQ